MLPPPLMPPSLDDPVLPMAPALPEVPLDAPLPIDPFMEPELTEPDCEPGLNVPLVLLLADPLGDCCMPEPLALIPESTLAPGLATIPESAALLPGVIVAPFEPVLVPVAPVPAPEPAPAAVVLDSPGPVAPEPAALVCANARPDVASPITRLLATNKRDRDIVRTPECFLRASFSLQRNIRGDCQRD
jgi:hypothetical protein